jgi:hypothetical protein
VPWERTEPRFERSRFERSRFERLQPTAAGSRGVTAGADDPHRGFVLGAPTKASTARNSGRTCTRYETAGGGEPMSGGHRKRHAMRRCRLQLPNQVCAARVVAHPRGRRARTRLQFPAALPQGGRCRPQKGMRSLPGATVGDEVLATAASLGWTLTARPISSLVLTSERDVSAGTDPVVADGPPP